MAIQTIEPNRLWIAFADSGPGMLVPARSRAEAYHVMSQHPVFKCCAIGIELFESMSEREQVAAKARGWFTEQTEIISTPYAANTDPQHPNFVRGQAPKTEPSAA